MDYLKSKNITACGILDDNLFSSLCFYNSCIKNDIKPIIGLCVYINNYKLYLYAKNYDGFLNLLKLNTLVQKDGVNYIDLKSHKSDIVCCLPYSSIDIYKEVKDIYSDFYIGYKDDYEKVARKELSWGPGGTVGEERELWPTPLFMSLTLSWT